MRDHTALDRDVQKLRAAIQTLEELGDGLTETGQELLAECSSLMGRLTLLRNGIGGPDEARHVSKRVRAVYVAARRDRLRLVREPYSPVDPNEGSGAPGAA